jgi:hypothetical protein
VIDLLEHPAKAETVGRAGRAFLSRIDPDRVMRQVETLLSGDEAPEWEKQVPHSSETFRARDESPCLATVS